MYLQSIASLSYDGRVKKVFLITVFFLLLLAGSAKTSYAACELTASYAINSLNNTKYNDAQHIPPNTDVIVHLENPTNCPKGLPLVTVQYFVYPESFDGKYNEYDKFWIGTIQTNDPSSIDINVPLQENRFNTRSGRFVIKICDINANKTCDNDTKIDARAVINVDTPTAPTSAPTPIPTNVPKGFPKASFLQNHLCQFKAGTDVRILLQDLVPGEEYGWWWYDYGLIQNPLGTQPVNYFTVPQDSHVETIPGATTAEEFQNNPDKNHVLCFAHHYDKTRRASYYGCTPGAQNTVEVNLNRDETKTCEDGKTNTRGDTSPALPTFTPAPTTLPALLPCAEGESGDIQHREPIIINKDDSETVKRDKRERIVKCTKIDSAIGEIPTDPAEFVKKIFTVLLSMAGGWATYLIVVAGYKLMFSQGEAEAVKEAREEITSAIVGIVFMLLSLVILRVIGVDMFGLPTFR